MRKSILTAAATIIIGLALATGTATAATNDSTPRSTQVHLTVAAPARPAALTPVTFTIKGLNPNVTTTINWADGTSDYIAAADYVPAPPTTKTVKRDHATTITYTLRHAYTTAGAYTVTVSQQNTVVETATVLVSFAPDLGTPPLTPTA